MDKSSSQSSQSEKSKPSFVNNFRRGSSRGFKIAHLDLFEQENRPKFPLMLQLPEGDTLYHLLSQYKKYDERSFMKSIVDHIEFSLGRTRFTRDKNIFLQAICLSIRDRLVEVHNDNKLEIQQRNIKQVYFLSNQYLLGRSLQNSLINLDVEKSVKSALMQLGMNLEEIYDLEIDPGLGNGGLGRLCACLLDSIATLNIPCQAYGIRYTFGSFKQKIYKMKQIEVPDYWLTKGHPWELEKKDITYTIKFYGKINRINGRVEWVKTHNVLAVAYDNPIPGYNTINTVNLRLWSCIPSEKNNLENFHTKDYDTILQEQMSASLITQRLNVSLNNKKDQMINFKQEYFFISATIQDIIRRFLIAKNQWQNLPQKVAIHINSSSQSLAILELMRIMMDEEGFSFLPAFNLVSSVFTYTNHSIWEFKDNKWETSFLNEILPRHLLIIRQINSRFEEERNLINGESSCAIISIEDTEVVSISNLVFYCCKKLNGVSEEHTNLLKKKYYQEMNQLFKNKMINVTNGVTQRRWILTANKSLANLYSKHLQSSQWVTDLELLKKLREKISDSELIKDFAKVKLTNKRKTIKWIEETQGIKITEDFMFDVMFKKIYQYKRHLLYCFYVIDKYLWLKQCSQDERESTVKKCCIVSGKVNPDNQIGKFIVEFILRLQEKINGDQETSQYLKLIYLVDYSVKVAEKVIPAADLSQNLSVGHYEASGTSNMKFLMNGSTILTTKQGSYFEIVKNLNQKNIFTLGKSPEKIQEIQKLNQIQDFEEYFPKKLQEIISIVQKGFLGNNFIELMESFTQQNDQFLLGADFKEYCATMRLIENKYLNTSQWTQMTIENAIQCSYLTTDRVVKEYAEKLWEVTSLSQKD